MAVIKILLAFGLFAVVLSSPVKPSEGNRADSEEYDDDPLSYFAEQASSFLDDLLREDNAKV